MTRLLSQDFVMLLKERKAEILDGWLTRVKSDEPDMTPICSEDGL
jgi:hypothetical protein